jgi:hypothetical protein
MPIRIDFEIVFAIYSSGGMEAQSKVYGFTRFRELDPDTFGIGECLVH